VAQPSTKSEQEPEAVSTPGKHGGARPGAGRPKGSDTYRPEYAEQAEKLCRLGATDAEMADFFGVDEQTLNNWKQTHLDFFESLKRGKVEADANVATRLYQRAMGYSHQAVKTFNDGGKEMRVPYTEHYPPDTTAAIFWLKNRRPEQWRDKAHQELSGPGGSPLVPVVHVRLSDPRSRTTPQAGPSPPDVGQ
jgi:hypothetical protein